MPKSHRLRRLQERDVFTVERDSKYVCFKIPTLFITRNGSWLALTEARDGDCQDWDYTDIVVRKSYDMGETWSETSLVVAGLFGNHRVAGNIAPVQDRRSGRIFLP